MSLMNKRGPSADRSTRRSNRRSFFQPPSSRGQILDRLRGKERLSRRELGNLIRNLDENESLHDSALYPIQGWQFGGASNSSRWVVIRWSTNRIDPVYCGFSIRVPG